eukprot:gene13029-biopygen7351
MQQCKNALWPGTGNHRRGAAPAHPARLSAQIASVLDWPAGQIGRPESDSPILGVPRRPPRSSAELRGAPRSSAELRGGFPKELFRGGHVKDLRGAPRRSRERALPKELFRGTSTAEVFQKTSFESPPRSSAELRGGLSKELF